MSSISKAVTDFTWARLVPELLVTNIDASMRFWRDLCGFSVAFDRLYEGFAYLERDGAQIMLEELGRSRNWIVGPMEAPFGRGINFQVGVRTITPILASLAAADWPLFMSRRRNGTGLVMLRRASNSSWFKTQTDILSDFRQGSVSARYHSEGPLRSFTRGSSRLQIRPCFPLIAIEFCAAAEFPDVQPAPKGMATAMAPRNRFPIYRNFP